MVDSKGNSAMHLDMLRRALLILGCLLFLGSAIFPFLHEDRHYMIGENLDRNTYWSFKSSTQRIRLLHFPEPVEYWFYDYWVREYADRSELLLVCIYVRDSNPNVNSWDNFCFSQQENSGSCSSSPMPNGHCINGLRGHKF